MLAEPGRRGFPDDETLRWIQPRIREFFRRRLPEHVDVGDLVAEVMLAFAGFRGESSPKHYAFMVARRVLAQYHRKPQQTVPPASEEEFLDPCSGMTTRMQRLERQQLVRSEAAAIDPPFADVVLLSLDGHSPLEIAARLGINENTVRSRLSRGLARLRSRLGAAVSHSM